MKIQLEHEFMRVLVIKYLEMVMRMPMPNSFQKLHIAVRAIRLSLYLNDDLTMDCETIEIIT